MTTNPHTSPGAPAERAPDATLGLVKVRVHAHPERGFWRGEHDGRSLFWPGGVEGTELELPAALVQRLEAEPNLRVQRLDGSAALSSPEASPEPSLLGPEPKHVQGPDGTLAGPPAARRPR